MQTELMPIFNLRLFLFDNENSKDFFNIFQNVITRTSLSAQDLIKSDYFHKMQNNMNNDALEKNIFYAEINKKYNIKFNSFPYFENDTKNLENCALPNCVYKLTESFYADIEKHIININGEIISINNINKSSVLKVPHYISTNRKNIALKQIFEQITTSH